MDHRFLNDLPAFAERNPSAENLALYIYEEMSTRLGGELEKSAARVVEVVVQETDTAWAIYRPE